MHELTLVRSLGQCLYSDSLMLSIAALKHRQLEIMSACPFFLLKVFIMCLTTYIHNTMLNSVTIYLVLPDENLNREVRGW